MISEAACFDRDDADYNSVPDQSLWPGGLDDFSHRAQEKWQNNRMEFNLLSHFDATGPGVVDLLEDVIK